MGKAVGIIIAIFLFTIVAVMTIIIRNIQLLYRTYKDKNKFNLEQRDRLICLNICKIEIPEKYYNRTYEYLIKFENVDNHQIIELYVEEYDAKELYINDEYLITHDGIVAFNIYKTMF